MIATYARRARGHDHPLAFVLEQPSSPREYKPEVVSFWDQWEWHEIKKEFELKETHFTQRAWVGKPRNPPLWELHLIWFQKIFKSKVLFVLGEFDRQKILLGGHLV